MDDYKPEYGKNFFHALRIQYNWRVMKGIKSKFGRYRFKYNNQIYKNWYVIKKSQPAPSGCSCTNCIKCNPK